MNPRKIFKKIKKSNRKMLNEQEAREILKHYKIPLVKGIATKKIEDAIKFAKKNGYPLAMKIISPDVVHKTDVGGVVLNIRNEKQVRDAYFRIIKNMKKINARVSGIFVQQMIEDGYEVMIGGKKDPTFGPTIAFGLGGIFVEVFNDVSFRIVPINKQDAEQMIKEIKGYKILNGYRGKPKADMKSLIDILMKISKMLKENPEIKELDLNPVFALKDKAIVVDTRIICE